MNSNLLRRCAVACALSFLAVQAYATNVPANLTATANGSNITLTWSDTSTDEAGFTVKFDTSSNFSNPQYVWAGGANTTSYVHAGLDPGTTYYYEVKTEGATDAQDSAFSAAAGATLAPIGLATTVVSSSRIDLSWTSNPSNAAVTGYTVARNTSASFSGASYQFVSGAGNVTLSETALAGGVPYYFAVKAEGTSNTYDSPWTAFVSAATPASPAPISAHFFGVNAWMPYQIGAHVFNGSLASQWTNVQNSGAKIMRYGGHGVDQYADSAWADSTTSTLAQYLGLVDDMQSRGIEPVLAVPVYGTTYTETKAADIVRFINVTHGRGVKYWIIGNEPEFAPYLNTTAQVASKIRSFSAAMKAVDPTITIIGPELAWYDTNLLNALTDPTSSDDITGADPATGRWYIDELSYHFYNGFNGTQSREDVIPILMQAGGFNDNLSALEARIANCNDAHGRSGSSALRMAITEANVNYANSSSDDLWGGGAKSFVGGQWWAELMGIAMLHHVDFVTFWSTIEGSTTSGNELGFIGADGTTKRPSYYHFQMLAQNFRGNAVAASDNQPLVKTFAAKDSDQVAVLLMNQEYDTNFSYTVRLDLSTPAGGSALKVNVDAGLPMEATGTIVSQSTILLVFDSSGALRKKIEYRLAGQADANWPPTVTTY